MQCIGRVTADSFLVLDDQNDLGAISGCQRFAERRSGFRLNQTAVSRKIKLNGGTDAHFRIEFYVAPRLPFEQLKFANNSNDLVVTSDATKETLQAAPAYEKQTLR
jgi:hypothetical protein